MRSERQRHGAAAGPDFAFRSTDRLLLDANPDCSIGARGIGRAFSTANSIPHAMPLREDSRRVQKFVEAAVCARLSAVCRVVSMSLLLNSSGYLPETMR